MTTDATRVSRPMLCIEPSIDRTVEPGTPGRLRACMLVSKSSCQVCEFCRRETPFAGTPVAYPRSVTR